MSGSMKQLFVHTLRQGVNDFGLGMSRVLSSKDPDLLGHTLRIHQLSRIFGEYIDLTKDEITDLEVLALVHDVGKIMIPSKILLKPGPLTDAEMAVMKHHCKAGATLAAECSAFPELDYWVLTHHEYWNGKGYPLGLSGETIPLLSRIIAILDAYDAMTSDRPYRKAIGHAAALSEISICAGKQFDPSLAESFVRFMGGDCLNRRVAEGVFSVALDDGL